MNTFGQLGDGSYVCSSGSNAFIRFTNLFMLVHACYCILLGVDLELDLFPYRSQGVEGEPGTSNRLSDSVCAFVAKVEYIEVRDDRCWRTFPRLLLAALFLANTGDEWLRQER